MMSYVVVGKNSFIARHLKKVVNDNNWIFLSHNEALEDNNWCYKAEVVINCAFSAKLYTQAYMKEEDIDLQIANKIKSFANLHYIMISSRRVYGDDEILKETNRSVTSDNYGQSKLLIEESLKKLLGEERLTILRCSNIFGTDAREKTFVGKALSDLKKYKKITLNMSEETKKDFVPIKYVCNIIKNVTTNKIAGIYNVGYGVSYKCGDIANWLIRGYGEGVLETTSTNINGQFFMDTSKIEEKVKICKSSDKLIENECIRLGQELKNK